MEAMLKLGRLEAEAVMKEAVISMYLLKAEEHEAIKMSVDAVVAAKTIEKTMPISAGGSGEGAKLLEGCTSLAKKETAAEALAAAEKAKEAFAKASDKAGQVSALVAVASGFIACGEPKNAVKAGKEALAICREAKLADAEAAVLQTLIYANFVKRDTEEAQRAAKEMIRTAGSKDKQAVAMVVLAKVLLASGEPGSAKRVAEDAASVAKDAGDKEGQAAALCIMYKVHRAMGKPKSALTSAKEALTLVKGIKGAEAAASLMVADAYPAGPDAVSLAKSAVAAFQADGNKSGEGAAGITLANAYLAQSKPAPEEALQASKASIEAFKAAGEKAGEAVALSAASLAMIAKEDKEAAKSQATEALAAFKSVKDGLGEGYANSLLRSTHFAGMVPTTARFLMDFDKIGHIEMNEMATQESLEAIVANVNAWSTQHEGTVDMRDQDWIKSIVLHLEGSPAPPSMHCYALRSGAFIIGVKSCGLVITLAASGCIAGPSWNLVLGADYRIASQDTKFILPVTNPPECIADLLGNQVATYLIMNDGVQSAGTMLEMSVLHQAVPDKAFAGKSAHEFAKRLASFPKLAIRQTMNLMNPPLDKFQCTFDRFDARCCESGHTKFAANYAQGVSAN